MAKKLAPTVIFVDEIDGLLRARSSGGAGSSDHFRISQSLLLAEWDALRGQFELLLYLFIYLLIYLLIYGI